MRVSDMGVAVVTPEEMADIDQAALAGLQVQHNCSAEQALASLIERAGEATAKVARQMLGHCYGKRVLVLVGKGNNGNDGRSAARRLGQWGTQVVFVDAITGGKDKTSTSQADTTTQAGKLDFDLIIDAAYGTGLSRPHVLPPGLADLSGHLPTLAVDIPSGVHGVTGEVLGEALKADATITFGAIKPGQLLGAGKELCGELKVAHIGLDVSSAKTHLLTAQDLAASLPRRSPQAHKWNAACWLVGGSPGMSGALALAARAAYRAGAGYVRVSTPGVKAAMLGAQGLLPLEAVESALPETQWAPPMKQELSQSARFHSAVVGPGLAPTKVAKDSLAVLLDWFVDKTPGDDSDNDASNNPDDSPAKGLKTLILDGGALEALGRIPAHRFNPNVVLTPHDKEYEYLTGQRPGKDRLEACRKLAQDTSAVVLLKGATTVVAHPNGQALLNSAGDERLATAGTGDVLAGVIGALTAQGLNAFAAAGLAAQLHGQASQLGATHGLVAGDLPDLLSQVYSRAVAV